MKRSLALLLASLLIAPSLFAQGNGVINQPPAQYPGQKPDPLPTAPAPSTDTRGLPLIPEIPPADGSFQDNKEAKKNKKPVGPSKTDAAEDAMQLHIKLRAAKTKALEDPVIQAEWAKAEAATKTDYDRREGYKRFYVLLYARMLQIDPSLATGIGARMGTSLYRNYQYHVAPTVPQDQIGEAKPTGPENAIVGAGTGGTPPPRRSFGQARIGGN